MGDSAAGLFTGEVTGETVLVAKETAGRREVGIFPTQVPVVLPSAIIPTSTISSSAGGSGLSRSAEEEANLQSALLDVQLRRRAVSL